MGKKKKKYLKVQEKPEANGGETLPVSKKQSKKIKTAGRKSDILHEKKPSPKNTIPQPKKITETGLVPVGKAAMTLIPAPEDGKNKEIPYKKLKKFLVNVAYGLTVMVSLGAIITVVGLHSNRRIYPRVSLGPITMGYSTIPEAQKKLDQKLKTYFEQPISFNYGEKLITLSPKELGMSANAKQLLGALPVYHWGESSPIPFVGSIFKEQKIPLPLDYDEDQIVSLLETKLELKELRAKNAHFFFDDKKNIQIAQESEGKILDREKLVEALKQNINNLKNTPINITLQIEKPQVLASQIEEEKERLLSTMKQPLTLTYEGRKWKLDLMQHVEAVGLESKIAPRLKGAAPKISKMIAKNEQTSSQENPVVAMTSISLQPQKINDFLEKEIISHINKPTVGVKIFKDEKEKIIIEGKGQNGISVDKKNLFVNINNALNTKELTVAIPVVEEKAPVEVSPDLQRLGIKNMIATGHTAFAGSHKGRVHNINTGIVKYNGLLIKPGEIFSFNENLGPVDAAHGYVPEKVIKKDKAEMEYGGGLCQVSSTAYRAALLGGLKIVERAPHSWRVNYYEQILGPGLDATIYPGTRDFKFLNDTPGSILIQTYLDGDHAYFKFYGTDDGRIATLDGPYGKGLNFKWYRNLIKDGIVTKETITSNYRPMPNPNVAPPAPKPTLNFDAGAPAEVPNTLT